MTLIGNIDKILLKITIESKKTQNFSRHFEKIILLLNVTFTNTFYGCLFKTCNQIENVAVDFFFKMHMV